MGSPALIAKGGPQAPGVVVVCVRFEMSVLAVVAIRSDLAGALLQAVAWLGPEVLASS